MSVTLSRFRVRSPERDRESDTRRLQRLSQVITDLREEMVRERSGLQNRHDKITANAAFSQLALEEKSGDAGMSSKIGDMTDAMIHYTNRVSSLDSQIRFLSDLDQQVTQFRQL
jgi:hypothetical protein